VCVCVCVCVGGVGDMHVSSIRSMYTYENTGDITRSCVHVESKFGVIRTAPDKRRDKILTHVVLFKQITH